MPADADIFNLLQLELTKTPDKNTSAKIAKLVTELGSTCELWQSINDHYFDLGIKLLDEAFAESFDNEKQQMLIYEQAKYCFMLVQQACSQIMMFPNSQPNARVEAMSKFAIFQTEMLSKKLELGSAVQMNRKNEVSAKATSSGVALMDESRKKAGKIAAHNMLQTSHPGPVPMKSFRDIMKRVEEGEDDNFKQQLKLP